MGQKKIAIIATHPVQYQAPLFRALAANVGLDLEVFFCHQATPEQQASAGFGLPFDWDVSLLDGYKYRFLKNVSAKPDANTYYGLDSPEVAWIIEQNKYDVVIVYGWHYKSAWQAMRACWRTKTPVMARGDSHLKTERPTLKRAVKLPLYRWFIPKLEACLSAGKWSREYFLHYGAPPERIFLVPYFVDDRYFADETQRLLPDRPALRRAWDFDESTVVSLFAGKFIQKKRPLDFVRAFERAHEQGSRVAGLMVGDGPLRAECERLVHEHRLPIRFTGFLNQSEIARAYVTADVLVLPSDGGETWGLVVNEAMSCGLPCIVSDHVGCGPDMVVRGETGDVFALGDVDELAHLLSYYAKNPLQIKTMRGRSREKARQFSSEAAVAGVIEALDSLNGR